MVFKANRMFSVLFAAALCWAGMAAAQVGAPQNETVPIPASANSGAQGAASVMQDGYVVGIGDVLDVIMVGQDDFKGRVVVQQDGTIQLPYVGSIRALNKTLLQLSREIGAALAKGGYYVDPAIQVNLSQVSARYVTVLGVVGSPGLIPLDREYRASEIIARVGGIGDAGAETFFLRREGGQEIPLTLEQIARGGPDGDPVVNPGDKIFVPAAPTYYIYGQVNSPGTFPIAKSMSMRMAIARSGGLTQMGSDKRITVIRNGEELKKFSLSDPIQKDDVIVVGERFF